MFNKGWSYRSKVQKHWPSLIQYLAQSFPHHDVAQWQNEMVEGHLQLNERVVFEDRPLTSGTEVVWSKPPWEEPRVEGEPTILYHENDLVVLNKPAGWPVLPGAGYLDNTVLNWLRRHFPRHPPAPLHRLGRGTTGVLLCARQGPIAKEWNEDFRLRKI